LSTLVKLVENVMHQLKLMKTTLVNLVQIS
jgi:hypothetical protein